MSAPLYTTEILRLAASLPPPTELERIDGFAIERSSTCGASVQVYVQLGADGRVEAVSQTVQACAFGQASAALVALSAAGKSSEEIADVLSALSAWLSGERDDPGDWPGLAALAPALPKRGRHGAILLPFRALEAAMRR